MTEELYAAHPDLYDAIQAEWDYDRDVAFVADVLTRHELAGRRLLEVGCGTGQHTRRFVARGFDVTGVDLHAGMVQAARERCDAALLVAALPDLAVRARFDAVVAIRGVINHLPPAALEPALAELARRLADGGVLVFDNAPLPPGGNEPALDTGDSPEGRYARVAHHRSRPDGRLEWRQVVFGADGRAVVTTQPMTPFDDTTIRTALTDCGLTVRTHDGYGPTDDRTVFVAMR